MNIQRVQSIDALRGVTIFAMILCAAISYDAGLPAWMFHCQVPPPDYVFHPEVRGITWVDMVFPFFIFALGAALPFSLGRKLENGESLLKVCLGVVKRWAVLVVFALVLGHADCLGQSTLGPTAAALMRLGIWLALFAALVKTKRWWVNFAGWILLFACFAALHFGFDLPLSLAQNDCIILLLSTVVLLGSFIWIFTRNSLRLRILAWIILITMKLIGWDWEQYLIIALPATMAGDILRRPVTFTSARQGVSSIVGLLAVFVQLWGLYTRNVCADAIISACLGAVFLALTFRSRETSVQVGRMGFFMLLAGIAFDPFDGGIAKDYCNLSYLLLTGGQAALTLYFLMWLESRRPLSRNLTMLGQNPMIAYTIAWFVICPLLSVIGLMDIMNAMGSGNPVLGVVRGVVITLIMTAFTCLFTYKKIFWKS